jgi:hypothetical protein
VLDHALPADFVGGLADFKVWVVVADFGQVHAAGKMGGHDVAAGGVEDGGFDAGVSWAECLPGRKLVEGSKRVINSHYLPVTERGVERGDIAVAYKDGL